MRFGYLPGVIVRLTGRIEQTHPDRVVVCPDGQPGVGVEALVPRYLGAELLAMDAAGRLPETVTLHTLEIYEGQGQGTSFVPRLLGFATASDRAFFELLGTVKGLGARRVLRVMAREPAWIAARIAAKDAKGLSELPEIGKKLAETVIHELGGKVEAFLGADALAFVGAAPAARTGAPAEAVEALVALGQTRAEAERGVDRAVAALGAGASADELVGASFGQAG